MAKTCKGRNYQTPAPLMGEDARRQGLHVLAQIIARKIVEDSKKPTSELHQTYDKETLPKGK